MLKIAVLFLAFIVFFVLSLRFAVKLIARFAGKYVGSKHKAAETIINTERPPRQWTDKLNRRITSIRKTAGNSEKVLRRERRAKDTLLKRIDQLIGCFETSPFVHDKETQQLLLSKLREARRLWEEKDWEEIIASPEQKETI